MLQSLNYFRYINCPLNGTCNRPYCVFKHKQLETQTSNETSQILPVEESKPTTSKFKNTFFSDEF